MSLPTRLSSLLLTLALTLAALAGTTGPAHAEDEEDFSPCPALEAQYDQADASLVRLEDLLDRLINKVRKARGKVRNADTRRQKRRAKKVVKRVKSRTSQVSRMVDDTYVDFEAVAMELEDCWNDYYDANPDWDDDEDPELDGVEDDVWVELTR